MWRLILLGLPVGLAFGFASQRGRFCINSACRDLYLIRDSMLFRALTLAVLAQMVGVQLLVQFGLVQVGIVAFTWLASIVGGLFFGVGMVLAGGCSGGSWYKTGEGQLASLVAVLGFAAAAAATEVGFLAPVRIALQTPTLLPQADGQGPTLSMLLGSPGPWPVIVPLVLLASYWLVWSPRRRAFRGWNWPKTGWVIGALGVLAVVASWSTGRSYGFGITFSTSHWLRWLLSPNSGLLDWESFFVVGIPVGAFLAARWAREFRWRYPGGRQLAQGAVGGALMGFGAMVMGGCTIGHSLAGVSKSRGPSMGAAFVLALAAMGPPLMYWTAQCAQRVSWRARFSRLLLLILLGIGLSVNNARAVFEGLTGIGSHAFQRTPKFAVGGSSTGSTRDSGRGPSAGWQASVYALPRDPIVWVELGLAAYTLGLAGYYLARGAWWMVFWPLLYAASYGHIAYLSLTQARQVRRARAAFTIQPL